VRTAWEARQGAITIDQPVTFEGIAGKWMLTEDSIKPAEGATPLVIEDAEFTQIMTANTEFQKTPTFEIRGVLEGRWLYPHLIYENPRRTVLLSDTSPIERAEHMWPEDAAERAQLEARLVVLEPGSYQVGPYDPEERQVLARDISQIL